LARALGLDNEFTIEMVVAKVVYARDKWRCGLCHGKVNPKLRAPDPMAASLDHVIPISRGGSHTYANVQCAHLGCNVRKNNRGAGEQLALI
jgi:5-methylcytosine-specific restriction endonuclease McrA